MLVRKKEREDDKIYRVLDKFTKHYGSYNDFTSDLVYICCSKDDLIVELFAKDCEFVKFN